MAGGELAEVTDSRLMAGGELAEVTDSQLMSGGEPLAAVAGSARRWFLD